jgi:hypothetical protein
MTYVMGCRPPFSFARIFFAARLAHSATCFCRCPDIAGQLHRCYCAAFARLLKFSGAVHPILRVLRHLVFRQLLQKQESAHRIEGTTLQDRSCVSR